MKFRIIGALLALAGFFMSSPPSKGVRILMFGAFLTLTGMLLMCGVVDLFALLWRELRGKELESMAQGVIEKTQVTGTYVDESPMVLMTIAFEDSQNILRHGQTKKLIALVDLPKYAEGSSVSVKYKFDDPAREVTVQSLPFAGVARDPTLGI